MEAGTSDLIKCDVIVIGGGIFGCLTAIELSKKGLRVQLHEKNDQIMIGASLNNQNRLHLGYHYPRDLETASQCQKGFEAFSMYLQYQRGNENRLEVFFSENRKSP